MAAVFLCTGAAVAAVFWQMPSSAGSYELYHAEVADKMLAAVPLPSESVASISPEQMGEMVFPDLAPIVDTGVEKYAQLYEAPASLAAFNTETKKEPQPSFAPPGAPQKFEPMRQIVEEKPIVVEPVNRDFPPLPVSVNTTEKSDELVQRFHFVEHDRTSVPEQPANPFADMAAATDMAVAPVTAAPAVTVAAPVAAAPAFSLLPLQPLQFVGLSPLLPLPENELLPLSATTVK